MENYKKRKKKFRIVSFLMAVVLVISTWNVSAYAQEAENNNKQEIVINQGESKGPEEESGEAETEPVEVNGGRDTEKEETEKQESLQKEDIKTETEKNKEENFSETKNQEFAADEKSLTEEEGNAESKGNTEPEENTEFEENTESEEKTEDEDLEEKEEEETETLQEEELEKMATAAISKTVFASNTTTVTSAAQFNAAIANENVSHIVVNGDIGVLQPNSGDGPLIINHPLTIEGGILDLRYLGIVLGADLTLKDTKVNLRSLESNAIVANGYTLTLENVTRDNSTSNPENDPVIHLFCGGITGYDYENIPAPGDKGSIVIKGTSKLGNIYAGNLTHMKTMASKFVGDAEIIIDSTASGTIGNIYGCGGRESDGEGTGNVVYEGEAYEVTGDIQVTLYDVLVKKVIGYGNNINVSYSGKDYKREVTLENISSLHITGGKLNPASGSYFNNSDSDISIDAGGMLYIENFGDFSVGDFSGGGELVVGQTQQFGISGTATGRTTVYIKDKNYSGESGATASKNHTYIGAGRAQEDAFSFATYNGSTNNMPIFKENSTGGGFWTTKEELGEEEGGESENTEAIESIAFGQQRYEIDSSEFYIIIPIDVVYTNNGIELENIALEIKINDEELSVIDDDGTWLYENDYFTAFMSWDDLVIYNESETHIPEPGNYRLSFTVPAKYMKGQNQSETIETIIAFGDAVEEEEDIPITKPNIRKQFSWNGEEQTVISQGEGYSLTGTYKATEVGTYIATATLLEGYCWEDGSKEPWEISWEIEKAEIEIENVVIVQKFYDGTTAAQVESVTMQGLQNQEQLELGTDFTAYAVFEISEVGQKQKVTVTVSLKNTTKANHYVLKKSTFELPGQMIYKNIDKPIAMENLVWDGTEQIGVAESEGYYLSGIYKAMQPGNYEAVVTLLEGYCWKDGSEDALTITWSIAEAENIPENLWVSGVEENGYRYTGKPIKPEVKVYDGTVLLKEKIDYTISYKNNVNANMNEPSDTKTPPTIIITGKGNYSGKETIYFKIKPINIQEDGGITVENLLKSYNKKIQKPQPEVFYNGQKMKKNTHYTISYPSTAEGKEVYKDPGEYIIRIIGKGNYSGEKDVSFVIAEKEKILLSQARISSVSNQSYTGEKIIIASEDIKVTYKGQRIDSRFYEVICEDKDVGNATLTIRARDDIENNPYMGEKKIMFKITGTPIKNAVINGIPSSVIYTGKEITVDNHESFHNFSVTLNGKLVEPTDDQGKANYSITYSNNINKGTAIIIVTGKNQYTGSVKKTFAIRALNLASEEDKIKVGFQEDNDQYSGEMMQVPYVQGENKPKPIVKLGEITLTEGKDYTVSYRNHTMVTLQGSSKEPTVIVKGKGNFTGFIEEKFKIIQADIDSGITIEVADVIFKNRTNAYKSIPKLIDENGKVLCAGRDYLKTYTYCYQEKDGTQQSREVGAGDIPPVGTTIAVTVTGIGNYTGTITGEYRIVGYDIGKAKVSVVPQTYTGGKIILDKKDIAVTYGKDTLEYQEVNATGEKTGYKIIGYSDNLKTGTAKVYLKGTGDYGGVKTVKFKITSKKLKY